MAQFPRVETDPLAESDLAAHAADTTAIHGIADTARLITIDNIATYAPAPDLSGYATSASVTATAASLVTLTPGSSARNVIQPSGDFKALTVKNNAAQTVNPFELQSSAGVMLSAVKPSGAFMFQKGQWHTDDAGQERLYFQQNSITTYRGGASNGTGNAHQWRSYADAAIMTLDQTGALTINSILNASQGRFGVLNLTADTMLTANPGNSAVRGIVTRGAVSQAADLHQWQDSAGGILASVASSGNFTNNKVGTNIIGSRSGNNIIELEPTATISSRFTAPAADRSPLVLRGAASQTASLQEWQDSTGTVLSRVDSGGNLYMRGATSTTRVIGFDNMTASSVAIMGVADGGPSNFTNGLAMGAGKKTLLASYYGLELSGTKQGAQSNSAGASTDPSVTVFGTVAANQVLVVKGAASQTGNLQEWQNSGAGILARIDSAGRIVANSGLTSNTYIQTISNTATQLPMLVKGAASQSANLEEWQDSTGAIKAAILAGGSIRRGPGSGDSTVQMGYEGSGTGAIYFGGNLTTSLTYRGTANAGGLVAAADGATGIPLVVKAAVSQSANLQEWQDSTGAVLSAINATGSHAIPAAGTAVKFLSTSDTYLMQGAGGSQYIRSGNAGGDLVVNNMRLLMVSSTAGIALGNTGNPDVQWQRTAAGESALSAVTAATVPTKFIVKGTASQGTTVLQEWQTSTGVVVASLGLNGSNNRLTLGTSEWLDGVSGSRIGFIAASGERLRVTATSIGFVGGALPQWTTAGIVQTTVGAAGGASALPATPTKYLKVLDDAGITLVVPAYAAV